MNEDVRIRVIIYPFYYLTTIITACRVCSLITFTEVARKAIMEAWTFDRTIHPSFIFFKRWTNAGGAVDEETVGT